MPYTVERLPDYPAILVIFDEDFAIPEDVISYANDTHALLDEEASPIGVIIDVTRIKLSINDLLQATKIVLDPNVNVAKHPKAGKIITVTQTTLIKMSMDGFRKMGLVDRIQIAASVEEALTLCAISN